MTSVPPADLPSAVDALVVGAGPAGLAAATWLARYRRSVAVLDSGEQRNRWAEVSHGYLGADPTSPSQLLDNARRDLSAYDDVAVVSGRAERVRRDGGAFVASLADGRDVRARRVILATGVTDEFPDVPGFFEHYGRRIFHCPSCDGYETRDRPVVVFGWSRDVAGFAAGILEWGSTVTVVTDGRQFEGEQAVRDHLASVGVTVVEDEIVELCTDAGELTGVRLRRGGVVDCDYAFFSIAHRPRNALAEQLGCELTAQGCVSVDDEGRTSEPGVYAAGDVTPGMQYVQRAASGGALAGTACALSLRDEILGGNTGEHDRPECA